jgi:peroxin-2
MAVHSTLTILVPYMHSKMQAYALSHSWPDAPLSDRRRRAWETVQWFESLHSTFSLLNFVAFLANGRYISASRDVVHIC